MDGEYGRLGWIGGWWWWGDVEFILLRLAEIWLRMGSERRQKVGVDFRGVVFRGVVFRGVVFRGVVLVYCAKKKKEKMYRKEKEILDVI